MKRLVTVVTGAGTGTGAATCRRLAEEGHDVVVGYAEDADAAEEAAEGYAGPAPARSACGRTRPYRRTWSGCSRRPRSNSARSPAW